MKEHLMPQLLAALLRQILERTIDEHKVTLTLFQRDPEGNWPMIEDDMHKYMIEHSPAEAQFAVVCEIYGSINRAFVRWSNVGQSPDDLIMGIERDARSVIYNDQEAEIQ
jgi:hypothetical protein